MSNPKTCAVFVHDDDGKILQVIVQVECTLDVLYDRWIAMGMKCVKYFGGEVAPDAMFNSYVVNGFVQAKPATTVIGEVRAIKADGVDSLSFQVTPANVNVSVYFDQNLIAQQDISGTLEFAADHPGTYQIFVAPPFPYKVNTFSIEVTA